MYLIVDLRMYECMYVKVNCMYVCMYVCMYKFVDVFIRKYMCVFSYEYDCLDIYLHDGFNKFTDFFVQAFKIVVDS